MLQNNKSNNYRGCGDRLAVSILGVQLLTACRYPSYNDLTARVSNQATPALPQMSKVDGESIITCKCIQVALSVLL